MDNSNSDETVAETAVKIVAPEVAFLAYLESRGLLAELKATCERHTANNLAQGRATTLYPFEVSVDALDLLEMDGSFGRLMLNELPECQRIITEVIYNVLISHEWLDPPLKNIGQLLVTVRITALPHCPEFDIRCIDDLSKKSKVPGYCTFDGVIVTLSTVSKYTLGASYLCVLDACPGSEGNTFTRMHVPGAHEKQTVSEKFLCTFCGGNLRENLKDRILAEKVIGEMVPENALAQTSRSSYSVQAINVYFRGSLTQNLVIGHSYSLIAMPICKPLAGSRGRRTYALEANNLEDITNGQMYDYFGSFPQNIDQLLTKFHVEDLADFPCVRPLLFAFAFAERIVPSGLFVKVKLGILLRLVNCGNTAKKTRASLLVVGHETSLMDRLLRYGATFSSRYMPLIVETQLSLTCSRRKPSGTLFVDGNPILLASSGVCYLGDVGKFSSASKRALANILDTSGVPLDASNPNNGDSGEPYTSMSYPVECQFWAYVDPHCECGGDDYLVTSKLKKESGRIPKYLLDAFGLVCYVDNATIRDNELKNEALEDYYLDMACGYSNRENSISDGDFERILKLARRQKVTFDPRAEVLIQDYFVASRRIRGSEEQNAPLPLSAILALTCNAESLAKLSFRDVVTKEDAILAIYLYEECVTTRYGVSFLHVRPRPHSFGCDTRTQLVKILSDLEQFGSLLSHHVASTSTERKSYARIEE